MKICNTCTSRSEGSPSIYKAKYDKFIEKYAPKTNRPYHNPDTIRVRVEGVKPETLIFYFAAMPRDFTKKILMRDSAYDKLQNSGVTKSNDKGIAYFYIKCPQIYQVPEKKIFSRHFHFLYWRDNQWEKTVYTHKILCNVDREFVLNYINRRNVIIIDALPRESFNEWHIEGAINVPYDRSINRAKLLKDIKMRTGKDEISLSVPIIIYSWDKYCEAAAIVKERLDRLGFCNTLYYQEGIKLWKE